MFESGEALHLAIEQVADASEQGAGPEVEVGQVGGDIAAKQLADAGAGKLFQRQRVARVQRRTSSSHADSSPARSLSGSNKELC